MSTPTEPKLPKLAGIYGRGAETQAHRHTRSALALLRACLDSPAPLAQGALAPQRPQRGLDLDATLDERTHASASIDGQQCAHAERSSARTLESIRMLQPEHLAGSSSSFLPCLLHEGDGPSRAPSPIALLGQTYHDTYDDA